MIIVINLFHTGDLLALCPAFATPDISYLVTGASSWKDFNNQAYTLLWPYLNISTSVCVFTLFVTVSSPCIVNGSMCKQVWHGLNVLTGLGGEGVGVTVCWAHIFPRRKMCRGFLEKNISVSRRKETFLLLLYNFSAYFHFRHDVLCIITKVKREVT